MTFLYVKDDVTIPTNQIISVSDIYKITKGGVIYGRICKEERHGVSKR